MVLLLWCICVCVYVHVCVYVCVCVVCVCGGDCEGVTVDGGGVQCDGEDKVPHVVLKSCKESLKLLLFSPLKLATHLHTYQHAYTH